MSKPKDDATAAPAIPATLSRNDVMRAAAHDTAVEGPRGDAAEGSAPAESGVIVPKLVPQEVVAGRYAIVRYIARGGMGEVYEAEDLELHERIALKTIRGESDDPVAEDRFKREILLARKVTHPNVCRIFDVGFHARDDGERIVFLTMELLPGETLFERCRREGPLNVDIAAGISRQIAAALSAAHAAGVVHRDLKSGNVILVPKPNGGVRAVVTDFGLAHVLGGGEGGSRSLSGSGGIVGTPGYMAPEQVEGGEMTARTDLYALGVVMFEMATGRLPFEGATPLSIAAKRLTVAAPSPRSLRRDLPLRWERAVLACLERDPAMRPDSARTVVNLLDEEIDRTSLRLDKLHRRAPLVRPLSALLVVVATSLIGWRAWHKPQSLGDELRRRGATLGGFESSEPGKGTGYGRQLRNAIRTELMFDVPIVAAHLEFVVPSATAASSTMSIGAARAKPGASEPLRIDGQFTMSGEGPNRMIEATLRIIDPQSNEQRAAIVERGSARAIDEVVIHLGERLRALTGLSPVVRTRLSAAGSAGLELAREAHRDYQHARALEILEGLLPTDAATVELRFMVGRVLASMELDTASAVAVNRTLQLGEPDDPFWKVRIQALATRRDPTRSGALLEQLHKSYPKDVDVAVDLATVLTQAQRGPDADRLLVDLVGTVESERDRLRIELTRLVVAERQSRWSDIAERSPALLARIRALKATGLELWAMRERCAYAADQADRESTDRDCVLLAELATAQRLPGSIALALSSRVASRVSGAVAPEAEKLADQSESVATQVGGRRRLAEVLNNSAILRAEKEDLAKARVIFDEALAIARAAHDHQTVIGILSNFGYYEAVSGHLDAEARYLREALELARDTSSRDALAYALCRLARTDLRLGEVRAAHELSNEARRLGSESHDVNGLRECLLYDGTALEFSGDYAGAARSFKMLLTADASDRQEELAYDSQCLYCESLLFAEDNAKALACAQGALAKAVPSGEEYAHLHLEVIRAVTLARLGRLAEARAIDERIRDKVVAEDPVFSGGWALVQLMSAERLIGRSTDDIGKALDKVIAASAQAPDRSLEGYARLERVALRARDHAVDTRDEARTLVDFATHYGYVALAAQAQRYAGTHGR